MKAGDRVRIDGGPLRGVEGFFQRTHAESQLIVSVTLLQRSVAVSLESNWVIPASTSTPRTLSAGA
jgi:transcription antitermination factor NusG